MITRTKPKANLTWINKGDVFSFENLSLLITNTHNNFQQNAVKAINKHITYRNWLVGYYIVEFEQSGKDRAKYGTNLLQSLEQKIDIKGLNVTLFTVCRKFYLHYPQISTTVSRLLQSSENDNFAISSTASQKLQTTKNEEFTIPSTVSQKFQLDPEKLLSNLSFSHIKEIIPIDDPLKRLFYEIEGIKCNWSVRELRRQISTLLYERCGMSLKPEQLIENLKNNFEQTNINDFIKQPFTFEFLGLKAKDVIEESDIETALVDHLQEFLLELGLGFCFEARQKRIIIDDEYYFADLVFYHRILHCHVIVELKNDEFKPEYISQLNTYVAYYKSEVMQKRDNLPVGILLCTNKRKKLVEYATAGMDNTLFVSKYLLQLPKKKELERFILSEIQ